MTLRHENAFCLHQNFSELHSLTYMEAHSFTFEPFLHYSENGFNRKSG